ncbi:MAG: hypothetical protein JOZ47_14295 [Kutzneria sp.]|nr:hypothetical protein [Kutzneria sp.]
MGVQRKDDRHSADPVEAIKSLFDDTEDAERRESSARPRMKIVGDLRDSGRKKRDKA